MGYAQKLVKNAFIGLVSVLHLLVVRNLIVGMPSRAYARDLLFSPSLPANSRNSFNPFFGIFYKQLKRQFPDRSPTHHSTPLQIKVFGLWHVMLLPASNIILPSRLI